MSTISQTHPALQLTAWQALANRHAHGIASSLVNLDTMPRRNGIYLIQSESKAEPRPQSQTEHLHQA